MSIIVSLHDELICCTDQPLDTFSQKFFTKFYQPILSIGASNLYLTLHSLINYGELESKKITHQTLLKTLNNISILNFLSYREELEALGLVETFVRNINGENHLYMIVLKRLPLAFEFIKNQVLSSMLINKIGNDEFNSLVLNYIVHSQDINNFENITKSIDEVYSIIDENSIDVSSWWFNTNSAEVKVSHEHFDYEYFVILAGAQNIVSMDILKSTTLYQNINRLAWMFNLTTEKLVTALRLSIVDGNVDYDLLRTNCKKSVENQEIIIKKTEVLPESTNQIAKTLERISPSVLVQNKYNTKLTPTEIEMFDKLLVTTGINIGVLNALIIYVMDTKQGEIPNYNYFLKIINTWIRKGVKTTNDALNLISTVNNPTKKKKAVGSWYQEYMEEIDNKKEKESKKTSNESLSDLEDFFNSKK